MTGRISTLPQQNAADSSAALYKREPGRICDRAAGPPARRGRRRDAPFMTCQLGLWLIFLGSEAAGALIPPFISPQGGFVRSPALVTIANPNPTGAIFYTLDGSDPRGQLGHVATNARNYSSALSVNRSLVIRARVKSSTNWSELTAAPFTADQDFSKLLFTELMYHPSDEHGREQEEFVELKNVGAAPLDVSGLRLRDLTEPGFTQFSFPQNAVVPPGGFLVLAFNTNVFQSLSPARAWTERLLVVLTSVPVCRR